MSGTGDPPSHLPNAVHNYLQNVKKILNPYDNSDEDDVPVDGKTIFLRNMATGGVSSAVAVTVMAPFERIKLILQVQKSINATPGRILYTGLGDALVRIRREQGFLSFWRGNVASVVRGFPYQALNFAFRDKYKDHFVRKYDKRNQPIARFIGNLLSGGIAGSSSMSILYPLDYARTRLAMDLGETKKTREFKNIRTVIIQTYKRDGLLGLYRGFWFSLIGVFIYRSAYFGLYDTAKDVAPEDWDMRHTLLFAFLTAEFSATFAGFLAYPFDTVRRSMMMQSGKSNPEKSFMGSLDCTRKIFERRGVRGFYHGALTNVVRGTGGAIMLVLYDEIQHEMWTHHHLKIQKTTSDYKVRRRWRLLKDTPQTDLCTCEVEQPICPVRKFAERINLICDH